MNTSGLSSVTESPGVPRWPPRWPRCWLLFTLAELVRGLITVLTARFSLLGVLLNENARPTWRRWYKLIGQAVLVTFIIILQKNNQAIPFPWYPY